LSRLPATLQEIADAAGEVAAVQLAAAKGGQRIYIPAKVGDDHWLVECVGRRAADAICRMFAVDGRRGLRFDVPLAGNGAYPQLRRAIAKHAAELERNGASCAAIAAATGTTERAVRKRRRKERERKSDAQGSLF